MFFIAKNFTGFRGSFIAVKICSTFSRSPVHTRLSKEFDDQIKLHRPDLVAGSAVYVSRPMRVIARTCASLSFVIFSATAFAQSNVFSSPEAATAALFPNKNPWVWTSTEGDLNGDGIKDLAMIITLDREGLPLDQAPSGSCWRVWWKVFTSIHLFRILRCSKVLWPRYKRVLSVCNGGA